MRLKCGSCGAEFDVRDPMADMQASHDEGRLEGAKAARLEASGCLEAIIKAYTEEIWPRVDETRHRLLVELQVLAMRWEGNEACPDASDEGQKVNRPKPTPTPGSGSWPSVGGGK